MDSDGTALLPAQPLPVPRQMARAALIALPECAAGRSRAVNQIAHSPAEGPYGKSETSVGYSTLYGDTAGGFAVLKDVYKTLVYPLARLRNQRGCVIPERILTRPPTAEPHTFTITLGELPVDGGAP